MPRSIKINFSDEPEKSENKKSFSGGGKNIKKRNWAFVLYPESAPSDWVEQLQLTGLQVAISPLHDRDVDPNGELKKAHYHIIVIYSGPTSFNVVNSLCSSLNQPIPKALESVRGYYRYFTHMDNPDKYQYDSIDIRCLNGFSIIDFVELTRSEVLAYKRKILNIIIDNDITEYSELMDLLLFTDGFSNEFDVASSNTLFFNTYLTSRRNKLMSPKSNKP